MSNRKNEDFIKNMDRDTYAKPTDTNLLKLPAFQTAANAFMAFEKPDANTLIRVMTVSLTEESSRITGQW